jgi:endonuclease/exonuclease/phosphatase (EEP) superfamily protein YafD
MTDNASALKKLTHTVRILFIALTDLYGIATCGLLALKLLVGESSWLVNLFNSTFPTILIPALVMLPGSALMKRWRLAVQVLPTLALFVIQYGFFFLPRAVTAHPGAPQLTILTFNTRYASRTLDTLVALIHQADADVVALQEFSQPAADRFAIEFAETYSYQAFYPLGMTTRGKGLLSKYPIVSVAYDQEQLPMYQRAELEVNGKTIILYNVHLPAPRWTPLFDTSRRTEGMLRLLDFLSEEDGPLLLVGDFNMTDQTDDYRRIASLYRDSYREVGRGLGTTFPDFSIYGSPLLALLPSFIRLDHVFHDDSFLTLEARKWNGASGSDHRPLWVRLALAKETP